MNERWIEIRKGADFAKIGETFSIDPVIARLIRNRDVTEMDEIRSYLYGGTEGLHDPRKMRDMDKQYPLSPIRSNRESRSASSGTMILTVSVRRTYC